MNDQEIPKAYNAKDWEDKLYSAWEKSGFFNPDAIDSEERYSNVLPPPNANGELHLGHASGYTVMDIFGRYQRMNGKKTLLLPGKDHAGIQTQVVFEKKIQAEQGITRHDLGREKFYEQTYDFCIDRSDYMRSQEKHIGLSADWSREKFTLDPEVSRRATETFLEMYQHGMIYRGERIINWCPRCATALSDVEVIHKETEGKLYYIEYPIKDSDEKIMVATTRPETMLGDTAVAIHPSDERYRALVGKTVILPLTDREIPIIADHRIDLAFGTGAVKITPAHDPLDWEIGRTHSLPTLQVINTSAKITEIGGVFSGLPVSEARIKVLEALATAGRLIKEEAHAINLSICERCKTPIEPLISKQWFVDVDAKHYSLKQKSIEALKAGTISFHPENMKEQMIQWLENLHDWCISRQLWWGHRIPVWYCLACGKEKVSATVKSRWFFVRHGETDWNKQEINAGATDVPLNDTGRQQSKLAAEKLKSENIEVIFASHLSRAHETAQIIGDAIGVSEIIIDDRLQERNFGDAEGMPYKEVAKRFPDLRTYNNKSANNESYEETETRVWAAISEHLEKHSHKNVLIASHGATLRSLFRKIKNIAPEAIMEIERFQHAAPLSVDILDPCERCGHHFFEQDQDTLDTWFSSGQWPYTTLGYPETPDAKTFYPTDMMIMGRDLLFFWATRMIMFGFYKTGLPPFKHLYFTGLVRDKDGLKMSKSKGNGVDVLEMIDQFGADAVRLSLTLGATPGLDFRLYEEKIQTFRNFTNKLWNMGRYTATQSTEANGAPIAKSDADHWILGRMQEVTQEVTRLLDNYQLSLAGEKLRDFTWSEFADWYVEIHKIEKNDGVLRFVFDTLLKLWHPFTPYVTEALWQTLQTDAHTPLMIKRWPKTIVLEVNTDRAKRFELITSLVTSLRNARSSYRIEPVQKMTMSIRGESEKIIRENEEVLKRLGRIEKILTIDTAIAPENSVFVQAGALQVFLHLDGILDLNKERERFEKEKSEKTKYIASLEGKLSNQNFVERAKPEVVEMERKKLQDSKKELSEIEEHLASLP